MLKPITKKSTVKIKLFFFWAICGLGRMIADTHIYKESKNIQQEKKGEKKN